MNFKLRLNLRKVSPLQFGSFLRKLHILSISIEIIHMLPFIFLEYPFTYMIATFLNKTRLKFKSLFRFGRLCNSRGIIYILMIFYNLPVQVWFFSLDAYGNPYKYSNLHQKTRKEQPPPLKKDLYF